MKVGQRKEEKQRNKHKLKGTIYLPGVKTKKPKKKGWWYQNIIHG